MAQLHALVDAPRGVVVDAAIFHVVLRLAQCFAADIPATVCIIFDDRYKSFLTISLLTLINTHECGVSRRFHSGSRTLRQKQRYCMARSVVGEGFRQPGQTQLLSPDKQQRRFSNLTW